VGPNEESASNDRKLSPINQNGRAADSMINIFLNHGDFEAALNLSGRIQRAENCETYGWEKTC